MILFDCYGNLKYPKSLDTQTTPIMMVTITTYDAYAFRQEDSITSQQTSRVKLNLHTICPSKVLLF